VSVDRCPTRACPYGVQPTRLWVTIRAGREIERAGGARAEDAEVLKLRAGKTMEEVFAKYGRW